MLLLSLHLSSGAPGRGREIGGYRVRNVQQAMRNIYFERDSLCIRTHYNKSRGVSNGQGDVLHRYPDTTTGYFLKTYILLIRPIFVEQRIAALGNGAIDRSRKDNVFVFLDMNLYVPEHSTSTLSKTMKNENFPGDSDGTAITREVSLSTASFEKPLRRIFPSFKSF